MRKTNHVKELVEYDQVTSIICDKCKQEYIIEDLIELQEFHHIKFTGGYGSAFGDMVTVEADICQHCLKEMIGDIARYTDDCGHPRKDE